jgi:hypothetical protein
MAVQIQRRHMPTHADRSLGVQTSFSLSRPSLIVKHLAIAAKHAIGNQLLEGRILFHFRPRPIAGMLRIEDDFEILIDVIAKALKMPNLMKNRRRNDQHVFDCHGMYQISGVKKRYRKKHNEPIEDDF